MTKEADYYNGFYKQLASIDAESNSFKKIEALLPILPSGAHVLDVGCGFGSVSEGLVQRGYRVTGMEINAEALACLESKGIAALNWDLSRPFQMPERFDLILVLDVLEHVFDPAALVRECVKVLNPGGSILVTVPLYFDIVDRVKILFTGRIISYDNLVYGWANYRRFRSYNYDHIRFFRPKEILQMLREQGLEIEYVGYGPIVGMGKVWRAIRRTLGLRTSAFPLPSLLAHSMEIRARQEQQR